MKKYILITSFLVLAAIAGTLDFTTEQVNTAVDNEVNQYGAAGYSALTNVAVLTGVWTDVPGSFTVPYASGFEYVSNSTIRYVNGDREFLFGGSVSMYPSTANKNMEVGLETNGVYVVGSTSGVRKFTSSTDSGSLSYAIPLMLSSNDTIGLVVRCTDGDITVNINTWQSWALRF